MDITKIIFLCLITISGSACSSLMQADQLPQYLENDKFATTSESERITDRNECINLADANVKQSGPYRTLLNKALLGSLVGSATGAVSGAIFGEVGESVASGAAVGTLVGTIQALIDINNRSPIYERFVEQCLHQKGYQIIGWESP